MRLRRLASALTVVLVLASPALGDIPAGVPDALSPDPVLRGALIAMPAVWSVQVTAHLTGLRLRNGTIVPLPPRARTVEKQGTAFAVTPDGYLMSALHVINPAPREIAATAYQKKIALEGLPHTDRIAKDWVKRTGARPVGLRPLERVMRPAAAGPGVAHDRAVSPRVVSTDTVRDLVVLRVPGLADAPSLAMDRGKDVGTPVASLGFGSSDPFAAPQHDALVPSVRTGTIAETGRTDTKPARSLTIISNPIQMGDSGGPVVDANGRVRGLLLVKRKAGGGAMAPTDELLRVLAQTSVQPWEGRTQVLYRGALTRMQRFDISGARDQLHRTLKSDPTHGLAAYELGQVTELATARLALAGEPRYRAGLLVIGVTGLGLAGLLAVLLWKAVNRMPGVMGPRNRNAPFDQDHPRDENL